jgi:general stress protein CsbA
MKVFNIIFIVLFVIFAALQYNDPDPYVWMPIYLYAAWLCYQAIKGRYNRTLYIIGLTVYGLYALYLLFDKTGVLDWIKEHHAENIVQTMKATKPWIEETREFGGLLIVIVVLLINMAWLSRRKMAKPAVAA